MKILQDSPHTRAVQTVKKPEATYIKEWWHRQHLIKLEVHLNETFIWDDVGQKKTFSGLIDKTIHRWIRDRINDLKKGIRRRCDSIRRSINHSETEVNSYSLWTERGTETFPFIHQKTSWETGLAFIAVSSQQLVIDSDFLSRQAKYISGYHYQA